MVRSPLRSLLAALRGDRTPAASSDPDDDGSSNAGDAAPSGERSEDSGGNAWDLIPAWQYDGRHVESGGVARGEQEEALRDVQLQAEAIEAQGDAPAEESFEE